MTNTEALVESEYAAKRINSYVSRELCKKTVFKFNCFLRGDGTPYIYHDSSTVEAFINKCKEL